jgi:hypothetical protein
MAEEDISLRPLLLGDPPHEALAACVSAATAALKAGLVDPRRIDWSTLAADIAQKIETMFDIRLIDVLTAAWTDYAALADCADPARHPADQTIWLPMVEHSIETILRPCLDVVIEPRPAIRISFEIACELDIKGLVLKIRDARIRVLRIGSCRAKATVKCEGIVLIERETRALEIPGEIFLRPAVPIKPRFALDVRRNDDGPTVPRHGPRPPQARAPETVWLEPHAVAEDEGGP